MLSMYTKRGALIVFEGCDRAGKTTQVKKLLTALQQTNINAEIMTFPDRSTEIGQVIHNYLTRKTNMSDKAIHLLFSANRWEMEPKMKAHINSGVTLIVDRYAYSGVAFSAAKEGMDIEWCKEPEAGLPKPDAVFFLTLSPEALARRGGFGEERYEATDFQENVRNNYRKLEEDSWQIIDADRDIEILHEDILARAVTVINKADENLGQLW
ncbi:thymidylate kinase isoform X4 [Periplaneta americana]|uniref:thymidylate kinase isoform X4 n=1 Tax=Periplaneta americana TaxID=6978 RepID=UPI0037E7C09C